MPRRAHPLSSAPKICTMREGAFTGEIASLMLKEAGADFVLLGHSERRRLFEESDAMIQRKVARALADDLIPVLCIGETLEEREKGKTEIVLKQQLASALAGIQNEDAGKILLAYEPVWAIGSGKTATPEIAQEAHAFIRSELVHLFGKHGASLIPILYGGSVKPDNAQTSWPKAIRRPSCRGRLARSCDVCFDCKKFNREKSMTLLFYVFIFLFLLFYHPLFRHPDSGSKKLRIGSLLSVETPATLSLEPRPPTS